MVSLCNIRDKLEQAFVAGSTSFPMGPYLVINWVLHWGTSFLGLVIAIIEGGVWFYLLSAAAVFCHLQSLCWQRPPTLGLSCSYLPLYYTSTPEHRQGLFTTFSKLVLGFWQRLWVHITIWGLLFYLWHLVVQLCYDPHSNSLLIPCSNPDSS